MLIDARTVPAGSVIETGVCIVGAGAAGITLARELAGQSLDVSLIESGGLAFDRATQSLYAGESAGLPYFPLDLNRQRSFGGTTNLWAGWCRPLDELDFEARAWVPDSGWPFTRTELLPYYKRAHDVCQLGPFEYDPVHWGHQLGMPQVPLGADRVATPIYQMSPPTRFGDVYREALIKSGNVRVFLHANAMEIETTETGVAVSRLNVGCVSGNRFWVAAKLYVLAAGGLENARLLLLSNATQRAGLGNATDQVGRYFMEHLHFPSGVVRLGNATTSSQYPSRERIAGRLSLSRALQEREGVLNHSVMLRPIYWGDPSKLVGALTRSLYGGRQLLQLLRNPQRRRVARLAAQDDTIFPALRLLRPLRGFRLYCTLEQAPNPSSRITLSTTRDALGLQRIRLAWRTTPLDQWTARRAPEVIAEELHRAGLGRFESEYGHNDEPWPPPPLQGLRGHHIGTTRMSRNPRDGVVDEHCQVHGSTNLFLAGSSVFPTAGAGTPTLTIVALALRLADRIKLLLRSGA